MTPTPETHYHTAAVCRGESPVRQARQPAFAATLAEWAENAQRRGDDLAAKAQRDLFA